MGEVKKKVKGRRMRERDRNKNEEVEEGYKRHEGGGERNGG